MDTADEDSIYNYVDAFYKCRDSFDIFTLKYNIKESVKCNFISGIISDYSEFVVPCHRIVKYLKHISSSTYEGNLIENCAYLNYKLNYEIQNIKKDVEDTSHIYDDVIKGFKDHFDSEIKKCMESMKYINRNELVELTKLIELHENFDNFLNNKYKTDDKHCIYGKKCVESYLTYIDDCYYDYDRSFCKLLEKFKEDYNEVAKHVINCEEVSRNLPPIKKGSRATAIMVLILFSTLTPFSVVFLLYKFTSFQSWINPRIKKKKNILKNLYENSTKSLENTGEYGTNSQNRQFNLHYNSDLRK